MRKVIIESPFAGTDEEIKKQNSNRLYRGGPYGS